MANRNSQLGATRNLSRFDVPPLAPDVFERALHLEEKRAERSRVQFVFMEVDCVEVLRGSGPEAVRTIAAMIQHLIRETDILGWSREQSTVGVIFTELGKTCAATAAEILLSRVRDGLATQLATPLAEAVQMRCRIFPDDEGTGAPPLCLDFVANRQKGKAAGLAKKILDKTGSLLAIVVFSPLFAGIAILIKLTSAGPVLFRQERVGENGRPFRFLKFRSMYAANDPAIHEEYVKRLIAGQLDAHQGDGEKCFKLREDPRVTPIGRFLRRTSLDELPQFLNVLAGDMSLVGPRPPIPYEVSKYSPWHMRRLQVMPGITGLWQVKGRSRTTFDEMVRMDLEYARGWSLWLDLKLILETPRAMFFGDGAY